MGLRVKCLVYMGYILPLSVQCHLRSFGAFIIFPIIDNLVSGIQMVIEQNGLKFGLRGGDTYLVYMRYF